MTAILTAMTSSSDVTDQITNQVRRSSHMPTTQLFNTAAHRGDVTFATFCRSGTSNKHTKSQLRAHCSSSVGLDDCRRRAASASTAADGEQRQPTVTSHSVAGREDELVFDKPITSTDRPRGGSADPRPAKPAGYRRHRGHKNHQHHARAPPDQRKSWPKQPSSGQSRHRRRSLELRQVMEESPCLWLS